MPGSASDLIVHRRAVVISGASGAGKTTMMRRLYRELDRGSRAVILNQTSNLPPHMTPRQLVVFYAALFGHYGASDPSDNLGIDHIMDRRFGEMNHPELSGGEKRRAHLMAILAIPPDRCPIILLDEPFQGLDDASRLMVGEVLRTAAKHRSIVMCLHHVPVFISEWIDEEWSISVLPDARVVSIRVLSNVVGDDPIEMTEKMPMRSLVEMWALIRYRDMLTGWRELATKMLTPIAICLFPMVCYGSPGRMWEEFLTEPAPDIILATGLQIIIHIVMFVCAIIPVVFLSTHVQWKDIVDNESACGLYRRSSFIVSRMLSEMTTMALVCVIIQSVLFMRAPGLIPVFSWASWSMMGVTHSLIWVCLYTLGMPFIWCLLTIIAYTAVCFISHIGFLLRWPVLQELSVLTVEMSLVLHRLMAECSSPSHARVIQAILSTLQTDALVGLSVRDWMIRSIMWYPAAPVLLMILGSVHHLYPISLSCQ